VYLHQAAQQALQRYAYAEAVSHLEQGLALLQPLSATPERLQQELAMQATLGVALMPLQGYSAPDVERAYTRARTLAQQVGETPQLFPVLWGLWAYYFVRGALLTAHELGEHMLALAQRAQDPALRLEAHLALGANEQHLGEVVTARIHLEQALALFDPEQHRAHAWYYGQDPQVVGLADLACVLWMLGYPDQAWQRSHEALTVAETVDHIYSQGLVHFFAAWCAQLCRNPQVTAVQAAAVLTLAHEHAFASLGAMGMVFQGWAVAMQGQVAAGLAQMREGLEAYQALIGGVSRPLFLALLAEAHGQAGQIAESLALLAEALSVVQHTGDRWWEAELYRLQGEFLLMQSTNHAAEAVTCFQQALVLARRQQAKSLELRAAMSLARLWQRQGTRAEAHALLASIYGWFTEGFGTADLQDAAVLLDELGGKHGQAPCVETPER
jgi:predicted ATPase